VKVNLATKFFHNVCLLLLHGLKGLFHVLSLMNKVQVLLFKLGEDHIEVVRVREAQVFIIEVILHCDEIFGKQHLEFGLPVLIIHVFSLELLELEGVTLLVFV